MASIGDCGEKLDLLFVQGTTLGPYPVQLVNDDGSGPLDLSGCVVRAMIRKSYASTSGIALSVQITDAQEGEFVFSLDAGVSATVACGNSPSDPASQYVWDLEIEFSDGTVKPIFYGTVKVAPAATKP